MARLALVCLTLTLCFLETSGHGRLMEPPSRSSAWRKGFNTPKNYVDHELSCGGFGAQWSKENGGKCGICGDPWNGPRENEAGGKYAKGVITANWREGQNVNIQVDIRAYHKGYFEFRICPNNDVKKAATQKCLDKYLLVVDSPKGGKTTRYDINNDPRGSSLYDVTAYLPNGLVCDQCVLQWKYNTGNSWGTDFETGEKCVGCGAQEQFYGCADVSIEPKAGVTMTTITGGEEEKTTKVADKVTTAAASCTTENDDSTPKLVTANPEESTMGHATTDPEESTMGHATTDPEESTMGHATTDPEESTMAPEATNSTESTTEHVSTNQESTTKQATTKSETLTTQPDNKTPETTTQVDWDSCLATGAWEGDGEMTEWCKNNCMVGFCPESHCYCGDSTTRPAWDSCRAAGAWTGSDDMTQWCKNNCSVGNCPSTHCYCP